MPVCLISAPLGMQPWEDLKDTKAWQKTRHVDIAGSHGRCECESVCVFISKEHIHVLLNQHARTL